ncbi:MAG: sensor histidine kinase, partial [Vicinamibacterales bacterium]
MNPLDRVRWWPRGGGADLYRVEYVLATARVILGLGLVAALAFSPAEEPAAVLLPGRTLQVLLLLAYSLVLLTALRVRKRMSPMLGVGMHVFDLTWAALGTTIVDGRLGAFSAFNLFAVVAAAYRWGLWETLATAIAVSVLVIFQVAISGNLAAYGPAFGDALVSSGAAFWLLNFLMFAWLLGYLGEEEKVLSYEASSTASLMGSVQRERGLGGSLRAAAAEMIRIFSAREFVMVAEEIKTGRLFLTTGARIPREKAIRYSSIELNADTKPVYLFASSPVWSATRRSAKGLEQIEIVALDAELGRVEETVEIPSRFQTQHPFRTLLSASFRFDEEWTGRLYLVDVPAAAARRRALQFLQRLVREVGPAFHEIYLMRRLRHQIGAIERARIARELHDGVIQSLVGVEMRLDVLKRHLAPVSPEAEREVGELQHLVHDEVLALRDLLQHMKPPDPGPNLGDYLNDIVDRYRKDTGIKAVFVSDGTATPFGPSTRRQIVRIVQESLVNIRKHSGARNVVIRMAVESAACRIVIDDDGSGYDFSGRRSMAELDAMRRGPVVIKERVRDIRGTVAIESVPGRG